MRPPNVRNLMSRPQFSSATLQILNEQGWEAAMPYLRREAGMKPQAELALSVSTRIAGTLMMGIAVAYAAPMLLHAVVPPGYADDDGFFDLIGDVSSYWTLKAREVIEPGSTARGANDSGSDLISRKSGCGHSKSAESSGAGERSRFLTDDDGG